MAIYEYRCEEHGAFDVTRPIGTAPASAQCPSCDGASRRVFSSPMRARLVHPEIAAALDHQEKTRHEPDIVTSLPPKPRHQRVAVAPLTPTLRKLPRP